MYKFVYSTIARHTIQSIILHIYGICNTTPIYSPCTIGYTNYNNMVVEKKIMYSQHVPLYGEGNILKVINYIFSIKSCLLRDSACWRCAYSIGIGNSYNNITCIEADEYVKDKIIIKFRHTYTHTYYSCIIIIISYYSFKRIYYSKKPYLYYSVIIFRSSHVTAHRIF